MANKLTIRQSVPGDAAVLESLYSQAFPNEDLIPLVRQLLQDSTLALSLVATIDSSIAGHVVFTHCGIEGSDVKAALLGPLAVGPARQRRGIGTELVREGLRRQQDVGVSLVCVLGDPAYYSRLGFSPEALVEPPYPLPAEWSGAWQSQLGDAATPCEGKLTVPSLWRRPELWAP